LLRRNHRQAPLYLLIVYRLLISDITYFAKGSSRTGRHWGWQLCCEAIV
jgi:hypothetical protein